MQKSVSDWNSENPQKPVELKVIFGKRDAIRQKVALGAKRQDFADAVLVRNEWVGTMAKRKLIQPLSQKTIGLLRQKTLEGILTAVGDEKNLWAIPFDADVYVLWARKAFLPQDLSTNDSLDQSGFETLAKHAAQYSKTQKGGYGFAFATMRAPTTGIGFFPWYFSVGGRLLVSNHQVSLDEKAVKDALLWLLSFVERKIAPTNTPSLHQGAVFAGLAGGAYGITLGGSWERNMLKSQSELADDIISLPVPQKNGCECATLVGGWSFVITTDYGRNAEDFLLKLFQDEFQTRKLNAQSLLPVNKDTFDNSWFESNQDGSTFKKSLQKGCSLPFAENIDLLIDRISIMMAKVFLGKMTAEEAVVELTEVRK